MALLVLQGNPMKSGYIIRIIKALLWSVKLGIFGNNSDTFRKFSGEVFPDALDLPHISSEQEFSSVSQ